MRLLVMAVAGALALALLPASAAFSQARSIDDACPPTGVPEDGFTDTGADGSLQEAAVDCIAGYGITVGKTATTYGTNDAVSREQMASFLMRKLDEVDGYTRPASAPDAFDDDEGSVHEDNINDASAEGIARGFSDGNFRPVDIVNRAQMASFVVRQMETAGADLPANPPDAFDDDDGAAFAAHEENINILAALDVVVGFTDGTYRPGNPVTRGQMAFFLTRDLDVLAEDGLVTPPFGVGPDLTTFAINDADGNGRLSAADSLVLTFASPVELTSSITIRDDDGDTTVLDEDEATDTENDGRTPATFTVSGNTVTIVIGTDLDVTAGAGSDGVLNGTIRITAASGIVDAATDEPWNPTADTGTSTTIGGAAAGQVAVSPSTTSNLGDGEAQQYTATVKNTDGTPYTGQVIIRLLDANTDGTPNGTTVATGVFIQSVDGSTQAGTPTTVTTFAGTDGQVVFVLRHTAGANADAVPQVALDTDTDGVVDTGEATGLGGAVFFKFIPTEAADGTFSNEPVCSTDKSDDFFVIDTDATQNCAGTLNRLEYDTNDIFTGAGVSSMESFENLLSVGDIVTANPYRNLDTGQSTFNLVSNVTTGLAVTTPAAPATTSATTFDVKGTGNPGWTVTIYRDVQNNDTYEDGTDVQVSASTTGTIGPNGDWTITVPLTSAANNDFIAVQRASGISGTPADAVRDVEAVPRIQQAANTGPQITTASGTNVAPSSSGVLSPNDTVTLNFNEDMQAPVTSGASADKVTLSDVDGTVATLTCGSGATCVLIDGPDADSTADDAVRLTLTLNPVITTAGQNGQVNAPAQVDAASFKAASDSDAVDLVGSADRQVEGF